MSKNSFWKDLLLETKWVWLTCSFSVCLSWHFRIWVRQLSLTGPYQSVSWINQSLSPHPPAPGSALCYLPSSHWAAAWTPQFHDHHSQGLVTSPTSSSLFVSRTSRRTWYLVNLPNIYIKKLPLSNSRNLAHCLPPSVLPFAALPRGTPKSPMRTTACYLLPSSDCFKSTSSCPHTLTTPASVSSFNCRLSSPRLM